LVLLLLVLLMPVLFLPVLLLPVVVLPVLFLLVVVLPVLLLLVVVLHVLLLPCGWPLALLPVVVEPCEATRQLPKPAVVTKETRQRFFEVPPVHVVPAGSWTVSGCVPAVVGLGSPLTSIWAATKLFPVPEVSTCTVLIDRLPSAPPLKSVMVGEMDPFELTGRAVEVSSVWAMLILPQGLAVLGF